LDGLDYLQPFLDVIKSDDITAPITAMALSAIHKFVQCGFLGMSVLSFLYILLLYFYPFACK
jgi:hypothetical protein